MKTYNCQTCGHLVLLEPREVEEIGAYCLEHLFSEEFPALNQLAENVAETEERPENPRQETPQTAHTETHKKGSVMNKSTPEPAEFGPDYVENCPQLDDMEHDCDSTRLASQISVSTQACERISIFRLHEVFQHGHQVHALRLEIVDEIHHTAEVTLYPQQLVTIAEWLSEKASVLTPAGGDA
ncbi:hypothetical protein [Nesterenkonia sphaerica]|uniref:Uncharacterized protein n=1 Tax=Nesterenkonia sphaerica TaxID=1804988 RepID=A0A5R9AAF7_9MICC|nr:hypothetical protein [Nesterenkonia sphaerica]TLP75510.1 hypothetical protein FEF27_07585 [Nesterenkonia sphaerica]